MQKGFTSNIFCLFLQEKLLLYVTRALENVLQYFEAYFWYKLSKELQFCTVEGTEYRIMYRILPSFNKVQNTVQNVHF